MYIGPFSLNLRGCPNGWVCLDVSLNCERSGDEMHRRTPVVSCESGWRKILSISKNV